MDRTLVWKKLAYHIGAIIALFLIVIFIVFVMRTERIINKQHLATARAHFKNIVLTRRWNANHGGVYVKKGENVVSNPYLDNPDLEAVDGTVYTKKNPALMTREISEYAKLSGDFTYHITSLKPLNPENAADRFEEIALRTFEKGEKEKYLLNVKKNGSTYRYMAPLYVEEGCMLCHAKQGYEVGDVRGGISVTFDVTDVRSQMISNRYMFIGLGVVVSAIILSIVYALIINVYRKLSQAYNTIELMSITDELTRIYNRRHFHVRLEEEIHRSARYKRPLSLIVADIDHFKGVNDRYGHQAGDIVLREAARIFKSNIRQVDVVARYGGEEFIVILPETDENKAYKIADKLRQLIGDYDFRISDECVLHVTASFGVSSLDMVANDIPNKSREIVKLADDALYKAKGGGRNAVVVCSCNMSKMAGNYN